MALATVKTVICTGQFDFVNASEHDLWHDFHLPEKKKTFTGLYTKWDSSSAPTLIAATGFAPIRCQCYILQMIWASKASSKQLPSRHNRGFIINRNINKSNNHVSTVHKKDIIIQLPYLGLHSWHSSQISKRLKSSVYNFYSCVNLKIIFQNTRRIKSFFPYKDRLNRSQQSKVIYKAIDLGL